MIKTYFTKLKGPLEDEEGLVDNLEVTTRVAREDLSETIVAQQEGFDFDALDSTNIACVRKGHEQGPCCLVAFRYYEDEYCYFVEFEHDGAQFLRRCL